MNTNTLDTTIKKLFTATDTLTFTDTTTFRYR